MVRISANPVPLSVDKHGTIRVAGTRLTLDSVIEVYKQGKTPEEIRECFTGISLADIYEVLGYYLRHTAEVETYLAEQEAQGEAVRREVEAYQPPSPFRERALSCSAPQP
ncbi:MAG: DUF433 domain-containing protein [Chloroflexia bacterium]